MRSARLAGRAVAFEIAGQSSERQRRPALTEEPRRHHAARIEMDLKARIVPQRVERDRQILRPRPMHELRRLVEVAEAEVRVIDGEDDHAPLGQRGAGEERRKCVLRSIFALAML